MKQLQEMISAEKHAIEEELQIEEPKAQYYKDFCQQYNIIGIADLIDVEPCDLVFFFLASSNAFEDLSVLRDAIYSNRKFIEHLSISGEIKELGEALELTKKYNITQSVRDIFSCQKGTNPIMLLKSKYRMALPILRIVTSNKGDIRAFAKILDLTNISLDRVIESLALVPMLKELKTIRKKGQIAPRRSNKTTSSGLKVIINIPQEYSQKDISSKETFIMEHLAKAKKDYEARVQSERSKKRNLAKRKNTYETFEARLISALESQHLIELSDILNKIPNENIRLAALKLIYKHNQSICAAIEKEYRTLLANDTSQYRILLSNYGIPPETYDASSIMGNSLEDVEKMLMYLSKFEITDQTDIIRILQSSNLQTVSTYGNLIDKGIITASLLTSHRALFDCSSVEYQDFMRNIGLFQEKKLNPYHLNSSQETFVMPHETLKNGLRVLEEYGLTSSMKSGVNYQFLSSPDLAESIDLLLELGYETNLEESLELLNHKKRFDRLQILKSLNIPVASTEELFKILTTPSFFVPDDIAGNYIYNAVTHNVPSDISFLQPGQSPEELPDLSEFSNTARTYCFDGVIISKNKVARNLKTQDPTQEDNILYGIVKGSVLSDEEYAKVAAILSVNKSSSAVKEKIS